MDPVLQALGKTVPVTVVLLAIVALGLVVTDGADWVTFVGALVTLPIGTYVAWRELDRYHAGHDQPTRTSGG